MIKPNRLEIGDTVGVIALASPPSRRGLERGVSVIERLGLKVKRNHVRDFNGYLAGNDEDRLSDLVEMFNDEEVKAIFCASGGYGSARIAAELPYDVIKKNPKVFWGYSDITFLHQAIRKETGLVTFHGPMVSADLGDEELDERTIATFNQLFNPTGLEYTEEVSPIEGIVPGRAQGEIIGGNLSLLTSTLGTPYEIDTVGKVLFIEDVREEPRSIDRMLNQLLMAGKLSAASAILYGDFSNCPSKRRHTLSLEEVLYYYAKKADKPTLAGLKIGHCFPHFSFPLGVEVKVDAFEKRIHFAPGVQ